MFDMTPNTTDLSWKENLKRGDVVLFRFPLSEECPETEPKIRPCLVLETTEFAGKHFAEIAYGTDKDAKANKGWEIRVSHPVSLQAAGLSKPTRFTLNRRLTVSLDNLAFDTNRRFADPIIGCLDAELLERMNALRAKIHALRDIALDRRRNHSSTVRQRSRSSLVASDGRRK